ncbi:hypothetical protein N7536_010576 [Penicillium majusculum]|nr:hypothetical protein N7536_010576 [Penicillium majusculum]
MAIFVGQQADYLLLSYRSDIESFTTKSIIITTNMAHPRPIPTFTDDQLELLTQLRERRGDREYAKERIMEDAQAIMRMAARVASLQLGEIPHTSALIPAVMKALEARMLQILQEAVDLSVEAHIDAWTDCWIFDTVG